MSTSALHRLQPVKETRQKQIDLWTDLILQYCRQNKVSASLTSPKTAHWAHLLTHAGRACLQDFILSTDTADESPLFCNKAIESALWHPHAVCWPVSLASWHDSSVHVHAGRLPRDARVLFLNELVARGEDPSCYVATAQFCVQT